MTPTPSQLTPERVRRHLEGRFSPIRGLTPELLASQIDSFRSGYLRDFALTASAIAERDDLVISVKPKREKAVSRLDWECLPSDDSPAAARHAEALKAFYDTVTVTHGLDRNQRGGFNLLVRQMMEATAYRWAVHEIIWRPSKTALTAELKYVPIWFFENTTGALRFLASDFDLYGQDLAPGGWLVTAGDGLMIATAIAWMFKQLPLKDWVAYTEKFGMPGLLGRTDAAKGSDEWDDMVDAVTNFSSDWAAVVSKDSGLELIEAKGGGSALPFPPLVDRMDRAIATIWRGGDLSTISKGDAVGANPQTDESHILLEDDAALITTTLNTQLDPLIIAAEFGAGVAPLAYIKLIVPARQNIADDLKVDEWLAARGVRQDLAHVLQRYGRTVAEAGEPAVEPSAPSVPAVPPVPLANTADSAPPTLESLLQSLSRDATPILDRLDTILQIQDQTALLDALLDFQRDLPALTRQVGAAPETAATLERALRAALRSGLTSATVRPREDTPATSTFPAISNAVHPAAKCGHGPSVSSITSIS